MAKTFEVTASNVKSKIDSVSYNSSTGKVTVKVSLWDPRMKPVQLILAQYKLSGGGWTDMTAIPDGIQKNTNINSPPRWKQHSLIWDAFEDVDLISHTGVQVQVQFKDSDSINDAVKTSSVFNMDLAPYVASFVNPLTFGKDTTPEVVFEVPSALAACNMHFEIKISENQDMSNPVQTIDSSADQTGWEFEIEGTYQPMLAEGCPDISALKVRAKCKHTVQVALNQSVLYYEITPVSVSKKLPIDQLNLTPAQMTGYPCNY